MKAERGFTLLEVMVALAILAILSSAILSACSLLTQQYAHVESRLLAAFAADNQANEWRLSNRLPTSAGETVQVQLGGRSFHVHSELQPGDHTGLQPLSISVAADQMGAPSLYRLNVWLEPSR